MDATKLKIVRFTGVTDAGEFGATSCPCCGAQGRYVYTFMLDNGQLGGAMAGCLKRIPVAPIANEEKRLMDKERDYKKKGWKLNQGDQKALNAINDYYLNPNPELERQAMNEVRWAKQANIQRFKNRR